MSRYTVIVVKQSGLEKHLTENEAREFIRSGNYSYVGRRDGKQVLNYHPHRVVLWNGSCKDKNAMHIPGEVRC